MRCAQALKEMYIFYMEEVAIFTSMKLVSFLSIVVFLVIATFIAIGKDYCFLSAVHPNFDKNLLGTISIRTCMGGRAYDVKYIINEDSQDYIWVPIDDIVDISTWNKLPDDTSPVSNYEDANHLYSIHCMSDVFVTCRKKCL